MRWQHHRGSPRPPRPGADCSSQPSAPQATIRRSPKPPALRRTRARPKQGGGVSHAQLDPRITPHHSVQTPRTSPRPQASSSRHRGEHRSHLYQTKPVEMCVERRSWGLRGPGSQSATSRCPFRRDTRPASPHTGSRGVPCRPRGDQRAAGTDRASPESRLPFAAIRPDDLWMPIASTVSPARRWCRRRPPAAHGRPA